MITLNDCKAFCTVDPATVALSPVQVSPRKSDIAVGECALAWLPWRSGADGFPAPAC